MAVGIGADIPNTPEQTTPEWFEAAHAVADEDDGRYKELAAILAEAYAFAAYGKGEARHGAGGLPWTEQRHASIGREFGPGFALGQAVKKAYESRGLDSDAAERELLGAITYLASAILILREQT